MNNIDQCYHNINFYNQPDCRAIFRLVKTTHFIQLLERFTSSSVDGHKMLMKVRDNNGRNQRCSYFK